MRQPRVELLSFAGCPNVEPTRSLVERVAAELRVTPTIELIDVSDESAAAALRFLGSPTVRVDGRDVEPGADERRDFAVACRVYRTQEGLVGQPAEAWIRHALARSAR